MSVDPLLTHAREFTDIETDLLTLWNSLQDVGEEQLARDLLDAGLMAEHYTSLLGHTAADRTSDQLRNLAVLREQLDELRQKGLTVLANSRRSVTSSD